MKVKTGLVGMTLMLGLGFMIFMIPVCSDGDGNNITSPTPIANGRFYPGIYSGRYDVIISGLNEQGEIHPIEWLACWVKFEFRKDGKFFMIYSGSDENREFPDLFGRYRLFTGFMDHVDSVRISIDSTYGSGSCYFEKGTFIEGMYGLEYSYLNQEGYLVSCRIGYIFDGD